MFQAIEAHPWYNRCKENRRKQVKTLHLEGFYVSLQQWADQPGRFQAAGWHESAAEVTDHAPGRDLMTGQKFFLQFHRIWTHEFRRVVFFT